MGCSKINVLCKSSLEPAYVEEQTAMCVRHGVRVTYAVMEHL